MCVSASTVASTRQYDFWRNRLERVGDHAGLVWIAASEGRYSSTTDAVRSVASTRPAVHNRTPASRAIPMALKSAPRPQ